MTLESPFTAALNVGPDKVCLYGERLVVYAKNPMDWPVREFCRVPIYFQNRKFYLAARNRAKPPFKMRYELCPWPEEDNGASTRVVSYDEEYVAQRDAHCGRERRNCLLYSVLFPLYPVLGLCWSGFKDRFLVPVGFEPASLTKASVALVFNLWMVEGIFVGWLRGGLVMVLTSDPKLLWLDWVIFVLLLADSAIRYNGIIRSGSEYHLGFCEWVWRRASCG